MATILRFEPRPSSNPSSDLMADTDAQRGKGLDRHEITARATTTDTHYETTIERGEVVLFTGVRYSRWEESAHGAPTSSIEAQPAE